MSIIAIPRYLLFHTVETFESSYISNDVCYFQICRRWQHIQKSFRNTDSESKGVVNFEQLRGELNVRIRCDPFGKICMTWP